MKENKNLPVLPNTDFSEKDIQKIDEFKEAGLPGIATVDQILMARIMDLYLSGKTYRQISTITRIPVAIILFLSQKFSWFQVRTEYLEDLESTIKARLIESRLINQDFLLQLVHVWQKKIGNSITKYLATDNEVHANAIDLKEVDKYLKTLEALHKLSTDPRAAPTGGTAPIGLNVGEGMSITKNSDGGIDITPKSKAIGDMLKQFADSRREEEKPKMVEIESKDSKK